MVSEFNIVRMVVHTLDLNRENYKFENNARDLEKEAVTWLTTEPGIYVKSHSVVRPAIKRRGNTQENFVFEIIAHLRSEDAMYYTLKYL